MLYLKKLKTLLQHNTIYYVVLFVAFFLYALDSNNIHMSIYKSFDSEIFTVIGITTVLPYLTPNEEPSPKIETTLKLKSFAVFLKNKFYL